MDKLISEINKMDYMFLLSFSEEADRLCIKVCGSKYEDCEDEINKEFEIEEIRNLLKGAKEIIEDKTTIYEIVFDSYVAYSSRWESYTTWDKEETFSFGSKFRLYSKSKFLEYLNKSTFASQMIEFKHYGVYCINQIIDIASTNTPHIIKRTL